MKVVYIHGIGEKPLVEALKSEWDLALFGADADFSHMAYWADILHQPMPISSAYNAGASNLLGQLSLHFGNRMVLAEPFLHEATRLFTQRFVQDVYQYFFNPFIRSQIKERFKNVAVGADIVIAHSLGTVVAFEALHELPALDVKLFVTLGSPLAMNAVKEEVKRAHPLSQPMCVRKWRNFADPLDIVSIDTSITDEYHGVDIKDCLVENLERWSHQFYGPHSLRGYISTMIVKNLVMMAVDDATNS